MGALGFCCADGAGEGFVVLALAAEAAIFFSGASVGKVVI